MNSITENLDWLLGPKAPQPYLLSEATWKVAEDWGLLRQEGDKFYVGRDWVMKTHYMEEGE